MSHWIWESVFYHVYPLGCCGAPGRNDFSSAPVPRLAQLLGWLDHIQQLGANALYLGPLFESSAHGYDTADYRQVDRRLGTGQTLAQVTTALHGRGMRVILDGVFHHVGRDFWAFRDVRERGEGSSYRDWFHGLAFHGASPYGDPFVYEGWNGCYDLVKLNLHNPAVKEHLCEAIGGWIEQFGIDGLRLDVADSLDQTFMRELATFCRRRRPDFWLMGEVVHGDYRQWANPQTLDSVTNYECYKGLYSSLVDRNYYEIAYALNRQFGAGGLYQGLPLYNFADNHDVSRVASSLGDPAHLYPLYCLLFTMPGVPSIYYGSEWGLQATKSNGRDEPLRPHLELEPARRSAPQPDLPPAISHLAWIRHRSPALQRGDYQQLFVSHEQFAFARRTEEECVVVVLNAASRPAAVEFPSPLPGRQRLVDLRNGQEEIWTNHGRVRLDAVPPRWACILAARP